jgi:hypothetical protein
LHHNVHIAGSTAFAEAAELISRFGSEARSEAKSRASRSRDLGNVIHFCRWREVERMIGTLDADVPAGLVH